MGFVLKIAIASAALAAALVYGSEHGTIGTRPSAVRTTVGAPATDGPDTAGQAVKRGVRAVVLTAAEPA